jgi:ABC-type phosphate transport system substrate-binding protein
MKTQSFAGRLLGGASMLALSGVALVATASPGAAQSNTISTGIFGGGSSLISEAARQFFDCYMGTTVANDTFSFSTTKSLGPGLLPKGCKSATKKNRVEGLYASVGSGSGTRAYITTDPHLLLQSPTGLTFPVPNAQPPDIDTNNTNTSTFGAYPYPHVDFGASDSPLPGSNVASLTTTTYANFTPTNNWQTVTAVTAAVSTAAQAFNTANVGQPIQIPLIEVPVAIVINTSSGTLTIQSQTSTTAAGGAIQLSTAQLCAIFSGLVTDWSSTATIPSLDLNGSPTTQSFSDDNIPPTGGTPVQYSTSSLPIVLTYRSDGSGTSFIITNYLKTVCPLIDSADNFGYVTIFNQSNLPNTSFTNVKTNVANFNNNLNGRQPHSTTSWAGYSGSPQIAINVSDSSKAGALGYVSVDFSSPYTTQVTGLLNGTGSPIADPSPLSASVQDEHGRTKGQYHPNTTTPFIAPTPTSADAGFVNISIATTSTYQSWNLYTVLYPSGTTSGGLSIAGLSELGIPTKANGYPIVGTTYMYVYSCYADAGGTRVPTIANFLAWYLGGSDSSLPVYNKSVNNRSNPGFDTDVKALLHNAGFHEIHSSLADTLLTTYVKPSTSGGTAAAIAAFNSGGSQVDGCTGVTGGGAP